MKILKPLILLLLLVTFVACQQKNSYDILIRNAMIYDGSGEAPFQGDIGINGDTIVAVGKLERDTGRQELDVQGLAVSPGFINMLSWAVNLMEDGRGMSDLKQGVTLEVLGEGTSLGPFYKPLYKNTDVPLRSFGDHFNYLERKGIALNVASFVGAATIRAFELGFDDVDPTPEQLERMKAQVRKAMQEGALGIGSALIYTPGVYAETQELIEICKAAAEFDGTYITHMRGEGDRLLEAVDEVIRIAREANIDAEIYHLKAAGRENWSKLDQVITKINNARKADINIGANMYLYTAGSTGLDAAMPPWVQEGGYDNWRARLQNPVIRQQVIAEMRSDTVHWENLARLAGADGTLLVGFRSRALREQYAGKTLAEVAQLRNQSPEDAAIDLVIQDGARVEVVYFLMSEENLQKQLRLPYMSFCSDANAPALEDSGRGASTHPRKFGNFARLLGKYVRDEKVISLEEAIYKLTYLSAQKLKIQKRGLLKPGYYADIVIFNPQTIQDHATYENPHQYATGVEHVFVNGVQVLKNGGHTGAMPGRFVKGPGFRGK
ncbi:MAG: N-acyl-D-amino-acid deacylase family protein [Saprospiraceae bacterium]